MHSAINIIRCLSRLANYPTMFFSRQATCTQDARTPKIYMQTYIIIAIPTESFELIKSYGTPNKISTCPTIRSSTNMGSIKTSVLTQTKFHQHFTAPTNPSDCNIETTAKLIKANKDSQIYHGFVFMKQKNLTITFFLGASICPPFSSLIKWTMIFGVYLWQHIFLLQTQNMRHQSPGKGCNEGVIPQKNIVVRLNGTLYLFNVGCKSFFLHRNV